jgi:hypothetical protein
MGRCYEFGVAIGDGCEHAMVVSDGGGACGCAACGATCGGRFRSCAEVTSTPGYIPLAAPAWAHPGGTGVMPVPESPLQQGFPASRRPTAETAAVPVASLGDDVTRIHTSLDRLAVRQERTAAEVAGIDRDLLRRDRDLAARLEGLARSIEETRLELRSLRESTADLVAAVAALSARTPEPRLVVEHRVEVEATEPAQALRPQLYEVGGGVVDGQ